MLIEFDANTGVSTVLTVEPFMELCRTVGAATTTAAFLDVHLLQDGSGDIAGVPSTKKGRNTLDVGWSKGGETFRIDFAPLFVKRPFNRPAETRAYLPVEFKTLKGIGPCMVIRFSGVEFSRMELGSRPRKKKTEETGQPGPKGTADTQPDTMTDKSS